MPRPGRTAPPPLVRCALQALHYKEMEFTTSPASAVESLIHINNQLRQPEAAIGALIYAQVCGAPALAQLWRAAHAQLWHAADVQPACRHRHRRRRTACACSG